MKKGAPVKLTLAAVLLLALGGWGILSLWPGSPDPGCAVEYLIGMSQANLIEPWRITMNREIEAAASEHENLRVIFTDAAGDTRRQMADVEMLMGYGIDLLVISPNEAGALSDTIGQVYQKIPVIVLDRDVRSENCTLFIGPDNYKIGRLAGKSVARLLGETGGNIVEILGAKDSAPVAERSAGFADAIAQNPNIRVVARLVANWMQDQAEDRFKEYLIQAAQPTDMVFAQNDAMAYGAHIAAEKLRVTGVRFVGVDGLSGEDGGLELVKSGILAATFSCPTGGRQAVESALDILAGKQGLPARLILAPVEITEPNADQD